jgi:hypothetical protein
MLVKLIRVAPSIYSYRFEEAQRLQDLVTEADSYINRVVGYSDELLTTCLIHALYRVFLVLRRPWIYMLLQS